MEKKEEVLVNSVWAGAALVVGKVSRRVVPIREGLDECFAFVFNPSTREIVIGRRRKARLGPRCMMFTFNNNPFCIAGMNLEPVHYVSVDGVSPENLRDGLHEAIESRLLELGMESEARRFMAEVDASRKFSAI